MQNLSINWSHKNYCNKEPRCVKCARHHHTIHCNKPENVQPKCCHCGKNHPASYRRCEVIKELQRLKDSKYKSKQQVKTIKTAKLVNQEKTKSSQSSGKTYSQVTADDSSTVKQPKNTDDMLARIIQMIT